MQTRKSTRTEHSKDVGLRLPAEMVTWLQRRFPASTPGRAASKILADAFRGARGAGHVDDAKLILDRIEKLDDELTGAADAQNSASMKAIAFAIARLQHANGLNPADFSPDAAAFENSTRARLDRLEQRLATLGQQIDAQTAAANRANTTMLELLAALVGEPAPVDPAVPTPAPAPTPARAAVAPTPAANPAPTAKKPAAATAAPREFGASLDNLSRVVGAKPAAAPRAPATPAAPRK